MSPPMRASKHDGQALSRIGRSPRLAVKKERRPTFENELYANIESESRESIGTLRISVS